MLFKSESEALKLDTSFDTFNTIKGLIVNIGLKKRPFWQNQVSIQDGGHGPNQAL